MPIIVVLVCWLLVCAPSWVWAAIDCVDAGATEQHETPPADPRTISYTTPSGSNLMTFVGFGYRNGGTRTSTTVTLAGNSMTAVLAQIYYNTIVGGGLYYYANPPAGANDVVVDWEPTGAPTGSSIIIWTCSGVNLADPFRSTNSASATDTTPTVTLSSITTGDVAIDMVVSDDSTSLTVGTNQTVIHQGVGGSHTGGASYQAGADGGIMSWTTGASDDWATLAAALKPAQTDDAGGTPIWFP